MGADVAVHRNDKISVADVMALRARGHRAVAWPLHAERGWHLPRSHREGLADDVPILGVCLGHQAIGQAFGGKVVRATRSARQGVGYQPHGHGVFRGINGPLKATRYHSLVVERASMPDALAVNAETDDRW